MTGRTHRAPAYGSALALTLRSTAAAYGYTLSIATTSLALNSTHGSPRTGELFLFVAGGLCGFTVLELGAALLGSRTTAPATAFPFAGVLNAVSVSAALGAALALAHGLPGTAAWLLAPLAATGAYLAGVAAQVAAVDGWQRRRSRREPSTG